MRDDNTLSHTTYNCKYHIVIIPKYRRMVIYNQLRKDIGLILRTVAERKPGVIIHEAEACLIIYICLWQYHQNIAYHHSWGIWKASQHWWYLTDMQIWNINMGIGNWYYCVTVVHNEEAVKNYKRNQLQEDKLSDQMSMKEFIDPFTGDKIK